MGELTRKQAHRDAASMLGKYACLWRDSTPDRAQRFNVGVNLGDGRVFRMGAGGNWVEALRSAEANVKKIVAHEEAKKVQASLIQESVPAE